MRPYMIEPFIDIKIAIDIPNSNISNINLQKWRNIRFAAHNFPCKAPANCIFASPLNYISTKLMACSLARGPAPGSRAWAPVFYFWFLAA
jgi:hypothetical protein